MFMNKKVVLYLLLTFLCAACSDDGGQNEKDQHVTNMPVHLGSENEVTNRAEGLPTAEPTKIVVAITPTEAIVEDIVIPTATPSLFPTPVVQETMKKSISDRMVVKISKSNAEEEETFLYRVEHDGLYGIVNQYGEVIVEPIYEYMEGFSEGYAAVYLDGKYGYIDEKGNLLTEIEYDYVEAFSEGLAVVRANGLYGFIDTTGQFVIEPQYKWARSFSDGLADVKKAEKEYSEFITPDGKTAFENFYASYGEFHDGLARVRLNHVDYYTYGYMDKTGQVVIKPITDGWTKDLPVEDFSEGFGIMYIEKEDESIVKVYVNTKGEILGGYEFEEAFDFSEGLAYAERDGIFGYIDKTGEYVITGVGSSSFRGGLACCEIDGKVGFIDRSGELVIEPIYDDCYYGFGTGYAVVSLGEELICINKSGEEMWRLLPEE